VELSTMPRKASTAHTWGAGEKLIFQALRVMIQCHCFFFTIQISYQSRDGGGFVTIDSR
jgi:hypothetical protein